MAKVKVKKLSEILGRCELCEHLTEFDIVSSILNKEGDTYLYCKENHDIGENSCSDHMLKNENHALPDNAYQ